MFRSERMARDYWNGGKRDNMNPLYPFKKHLPQDISDSITKKESEIKSCACKRCGKKKARVVHKENKFFIHCDFCGSRTATHNTRERAYDIWIKCYAIKVD